MANEAIGKLNQKNLLDTCEKFVAGWTHFLSCIDWNHTYLDANAIRFMTEVPGNIEKALEVIKNG